MLRAGIVFGGICLCVHLSVWAFVCLSAQNLEKYWSEIDVTNLVGIFSMVNSRSGWKLVTFDFDI